MQILADTYRIIAGLLGKGIRTFGLTILLIDGVYGLLLAALAFWIAYDGSVLRGTLAVVVSIVMVVVLGFVVALHLAATSTIRSAIADAGLGRKIFDGIFEKALGIVGDDGESTRETAYRPTNMSSQEVETTFSKAANLLLGEEISTGGISGPFFWLAKRIQKIAVWATVRVIVRTCSADGKSVNLFYVRDQLGGVIDERLGVFLKDRSMKLAYLGISLVTLVSVLSAWVIRQIPW